MRDSIWQDDVADEPSDPRWDAAVPTAVVGAGIAGVAVGYFLARAGADVALYERRRTAAGASGRNAGFLVTGTVEYYADAVRRWGRETARAVWRFSESNRTGLLAAWEAEDIDAGWEPTGHLYLADDEEEARALAESHRLLVEDGFASQSWDADACREASGSSRFDYGRNTPGDGQFHPVRAVSGLARAAGRHGARFHTGVGVTRITPRAAGWRLATERGTVAAERVVLACAAPAVGALWPAAGGRLVPVRAQALATAPFEPSPRLPLATRYGATYWRARPGGGLVAGGERARVADAEVGRSRETPTAPVQRALERFLGDTYPDARLEVVRRWAGILTYTPTGLPWIGAAPAADGLYLATGWTGHGFGLAWEAGRRLAAVISGELDPDGVVPWPPPRAPFTVEAGTLRSPVPSTADTG